MKQLSTILVCIIAVITVATLSSFNYSINKSTASNDYNNYVSIIATANNDAMTVTLSANSKPFKEMKFNNRESSYDLTPVLNMVVEREKNGWVMVNNQMSFDVKNNRMVYMFLMKRKGAK
jgi:lipoprotein-anchoring transpeptidase ErfK/SrfK